MAIDRDRLLRALEDAPDRLLTVGEVLARVGLHPGAQSAVKRLLRELLREGVVVRRGRRFGRPVAAASSAPPSLSRGAPPSPPGPGQLVPHRGRAGSTQAGRRGGAPRRPPAKQTVVGVLRRRPQGFGFVLPLDGASDDVFLPPGEGRAAMDGDVVRVEIVRGRDGRPAGRFVEVAERRRRFVVGIFRRRGKATFVEPSDRGIAEPLPVADAGPMPPGAERARPQQGPPDGQLVKVRIVHPPTQARGPRGEVVEVLGGPDDPGRAVLEAAYRGGFADEFPKAVLAEAERVPERVRAEDRRARRDLTALGLVTIDGEDARDFDDAVFVERVPAGYRLVVAIADVAHYVRPDTALDAEATARGTSVYFPNAVLPMLPERLSNGTCSLRPNEDRLCLVADLVLDRSAKMLEAELYEAVMRSRARCTYTAVATLLAGEKVPALEALRGDFAVAGELARKLTAMRRERGAIDFDLPEAHVEIGDDGRPLRIARRERNDAHRLVEEFMLAANEAVARYFSARGLPTVYRVHAEPDPEKLQAFARLAAAHGFELGPGGEVDGKALNEFLGRIAGQPEQRALNHLLLRSMMQAIYSAENVGHFGLAASHYLHFTSPIRRYPDLMVHRLLKQHWARGGRPNPPREQEAEAAALAAISQRSSERERAAMEAERDVDAYLAALLMQERVGERFEGVVAGATDFGVFVELHDPFVTGLVRAEAIGQGWRFDEERRRLVFRDGRSFGIGDPLTVVAAGVNLERRQIDFDLPDAKRRAPAPRPHRRPSER